MAHDVDVFHFCTPEAGNGAIADEDVKIIGPFDDSSRVAFADENNIPSSRNFQMWGGHDNELWGTDAHIETDATLPNLSVVGTSKDIRRRRRKYFDLKLKKVK